MKYVLSGIVVVLLVLGVYVAVFSKPKSITIKKLTFSYSSNNMMYGYTRYELECTDKCMATVKVYGVPDEDAVTVEVDKEEVEELEKKLSKYEVYKWNGFKKSDRNVLDGNSFSFFLTTKDDDYIGATGYMKYPNNYSEVRSVLDSFFEKYSKE